MAMRGYILTPHRESAPGTELTSAHLGALVLHQLPGCLVIGYSLNRFDNVLSG